MIRTAPIIMKETSAVFSVFAIRCPLVHKFAVICRIWTSSHSIIKEMTETWSIINIIFFILLSAFICFSVRWVRCTISLIITWIFIFIIIRHIFFLSNNFCPSIILFIIIQIFIITFIINLNSIDIFIILGRYVRVNYKWFLSFIIIVGITFHSFN